MKSREQEKQVFLQFNISYSSYYKEFKRRVESFILQRDEQDKLHIKKERLTNSFSWSFEF